MNVQKWYNLISPCYYVLILWQSFLLCKSGTKFSSILCKGFLNSIFLTPQNKPHGLFSPLLKKKLLGYAHFFFLLPLILYCSQGQTLKQIVSYLQFSPLILFMILYKKDSGSKLADTYFSLIVWRDNRFWILKH